MRIVCTGSPVLTISDATKVTLIYPKGTTPNTQQVTQAIVDRFSSDTWNCPASTITLLDTNKAALVGTDAVLFTPDVNNLQQSVITTDSSSAFDEQYFLRVETELGG